MQVEAQVQPPPKNPLSQWNDHVFQHCQFPVKVNFIFWQHLIPKKHLSPTGQKA